MTSNCIVVGSCFLDYVGYCDRIPVAGETVHSSSFQKGFGGKGANQAYMVALLADGASSKVKMVSAVGADGDGKDYIANLQSVGVNTEHVWQVEGESTGLAMISVSTVTGQNQIVICPNATHALAKKVADGCDWNTILGTSSDAEQKPNDIVVVQNEIPLQMTLKALEEARKRGMLTVFNPAPAPSAAEIEQIKPFMSCIDLFCPNETEAALMTGSAEAVTADNAEAVCAKIVELGVQNVVMTMGSQGYCIYKKNGGADNGASFAFYPSFKGASVVDTTGAGDCFVGTMVAQLLKKGRDGLVEACDTANGAAFLSVQRKGTQTSFPKADEVAKVPSNL